MTPDVSYLVAFGGGMISCLSPCVLPMVPVYLSVVTGLEPGALEKGTRRHAGRIVRSSLLFVAGFSAIFILLGLTATAIGDLLFQNQRTLTRVSGLIVLAMAVFMIASLALKAPWLSAERRFHPDPSRLGPFAAPVLGAAFAFGWSPCIGPVLASILAISAAQGGAGRGAALMAAYSAGLAVPFLAAGLAFARVTGAFGWVRRHYSGMILGSSLALAAFGVLLVFNRLVWVTAQLQKALDAVGLGRLNFLG